MLSKFVNYEALLRKSPAIETYPALATNMSRRPLNSAVMSLMSFSTASKSVTSTWYALPCGLSAYEIVDRHADHTGLVSTHT